MDQTLVGDHQVRRSGRPLELASPRSSSRTRQRSHCSTGLPYLLSGHHVALELLMAFVPSVLALACSFTTGSEGRTQTGSFHGFLLELRLI